MFVIKYWYKKIKVTIKHWSLGTIVHILTRRFQRHKDVVSIFISDDLKKSVSKTSLNFLVSIILPRHQRRGVTFFFVLEFFFLCCCYCCWFNTLFSIRELKIYWRCWLVFVAILLHFYPFQGEDEDLTIYGCFGIYISFMVILWRFDFEFQNHELRLGSHRNTYSYIGI